MNESLLNYLLQLFALLVKADPSDSSNSAVDVLEQFLHHDFGKEQTRAFISEFRKYCSRYDLRYTDDSESLFTAHPYVVEIIDAINHEFEQHQKVWLVLQLLEFIGDSDIGTELRLKFIRSLAIHFNISELEFSNGRDFILAQHSDSIPRNSQVMVINSGSALSSPGLKHIGNRRLSGAIYVLRIASSNTFLLKYFGNQELFINSRNIKPGRTYIFGVGALIRGSGIDPIYYSKVASAFIQDPSKPFVSIVVRNIHYRHRGSKNGIYPFSFQATSGQLVGIMGGSGVGKSTLLNLLNGNLKPKSGKVLINGYDVHTCKSDLKGVIGYVPQDDLLVEELTVFQNLFYNALLCFSNLSKKEIIDLVDRTLADFDLLEARDLKVGNPLNKFISGGQRKRLNMAMELMREPSVLFIDEPTSGLSSMDAERIMFLLRKQTFKGKVVFANIHQPSSDIFKLFDKLIILDHGGRPIFQGNPMDAVSYFKRMGNYLKPDESECLTCGNVNTDLILKVVEARVVNEYGRLTRKRKRSAREWYELYLQNIERKLAIEAPDRISPLPRNNFRTPGRWGQMWIFFRRNFRSKLANAQFMNISMFASPLLALVIALFTRYVHGTANNPDLYLFSENDNIPSFIFMSVVAMMFLGLTVSAEEIVKDRPILYREKFLNLSYFSYINSKLIVLLIFSAIQSFFFVAIGNSILEIKGMFLPYWLVLFSTAFCSNLIGLNISAALSSVVAIYVTIPLILVPQLLLSGIVVRFDKLNRYIAHREYTPFISDLVVSRWAYEALCVTQFKANRYDVHFFEVNRKISNSNFLATLHLPRLITLSNEVRVDISLNRVNNRTIRDLSIIRNELALLNQNYRFSNISFPDTACLKPQVVTVAQIDSLTLFLANLKKHFNRVYRLNLQQRDSVAVRLNRMLAREGSTLFDYYRRYHNKALEVLVTNRNDYVKIITDKDRLLRRFEPVYAVPSSKWGRAHLYSGYKRLGNRLVNTIWFNVAVIWLMAFVLYLTLWGDVFRIVRELVEQFRFRKLTQRIARYLPS